MNDELDTRVLNLIAALAGSFPTAAVTEDVKLIQRLWKDRTTLVEAVDAVWQQEGIPELRDALVAVGELD